MITGRFRSLKFCGSVTVAAVIVAGAALLVSGCKDTGGQLPQYVVRGPLRVRHEIQRTPTESSKTTGEGARASEIRFFSDYVIIISEDGKHGNLYPVSKIKFFDWRRE